MRQAGKKQLQNKGQREEEKLYIQKAESIFFFSICLSTPKFLPSNELQSHNCTKKILMLASASI